MSISIIGFPDSGKSHWGKKWAQEKKIRCVDSDDAICQQEEHPNTRTLLNRLGKRKFQEIQWHWISKLECFQGLLICGGGLPLIDGIASLLTARGPVVYLRRSWTWVQHHLDPCFSEQPVDYNWYQMRDQCYHSIASHVFEWHNQSHETTNKWDQLLHTLTNTEITA